MSMNTHTHIYNHTSNLNPPPSYEPGRYDKLKYQQCLIYLDGSYENSSWIHSICSSVLWTAKTSNLEMPGSCPYSRTHFRHHKRGKCGGWLKRKLMANR